MSRALRLRRRSVDIVACIGTVLLLTGCATAPGVPLSADDPSAPDETATTGDEADDGVETDDGVIEPIELEVAPSLPVTVTDARDHEVEITDVSRIAPLAGSVAEIVFSLGLGDRVVARDVAATFPEAADLPVVTEGHEVSAEGVLSTRPTVVLADRAVGPPEALEAIARAGVPVVVVDDAWTIDDIPPRIEQVAAALGVPAAGEALVERTEASIAAARPDALPTDTPPRVAFLYLRGTAAVYLIGGEGSGADAMIEAVGGIDAGSEAGLGSFTPITSESLVAAAPDVILVMEAGLESVGGVDGLVELPGVAQTPAGRDRRVVAMDDALLLSFGPRTGAALSELGDELVTVLADAPQDDPA